VRHQTRNQSGIGAPQRNIIVRAAKHIKTGGASTAREHRAPWHQTSA